MKKKPDPTIMFCQLGEVLRKRREACRFSRAEVAKEVFGDGDVFWKIQELEAGKIRATSDTIDAVLHLVKYFRVSQKERQAIRFDTRFPKVVEEIRERQRALSHIELRGIQKESRYAPRT